MIKIAQSMRCRAESAQSAQSALSVQSGRATDTTDSRTQNNSHMHAFTAFHSHNALPAIHCRTLSSNWLQLTAIDCHLFDSISLTRLKPINTRILSTNYWIRVFWGRLFTSDSNSSEIRFLISQTGIGLSAKYSPSLLQYCALELGWNGGHFSGQSVAKALAKRRTITQTRAKPTSGQSSDWVLQST